MENEGVALEANSEGDINNRMKIDDELEDMIPEL